MVLRGFERPRDRDKHRGHRHRLHDAILWRACRGGRVSRPWLEDRSRQKAQRHRLGKQDGCRLAPAGARRRRDRSAWVRLRRHGAGAERVHPRPSLGPAARHLVLVLGDRHSSVRFHDRGGRKLHPRVAVHFDGVRPFRRRQDGGLRPEGVAAAAEDHGAGAAAKHAVRLGGQHAVHCRASLRPCDLLGRQALRGVERCAHERVLRPSRLRP
mmetsp:Transcript_59863/g.167769  ORF Transcript_59863/g.167769 Transcript_59863/m.167769 type:complete len:212 (-) Transcript_59863:436-1071(-)